MAIAKLSLFCRCNFQTHFLYGNCQIVIINSRLGLAVSLLNSNPAVTEVTSPWLTQWGEDKYGCVFFLRKSKYHIYYAWRRRVIQWLQYSMYFCTPLYIIMQKLVLCYETCNVFIIISHWSQGKSFNICRWNFKIDLCLGDDCCTLIRYSLWGQNKMAIVLQKCLGHFVN